MRGIRYSFYERNTVVSMRGIRYSLHEKNTVYSLSFHVHHNRICTERRVVLNIKRRDEKEKRRSQPMLSVFDTEKKRKKG